MPDPLPPLLRAYRAMSAAAPPVVGLLARRRIKQGKEDPARVSERRGIAGKPRPDGPLVWIHGASVGEVLAAAALIERLRARGFHVLVTSGTVTSAAIVAKRFPAEVLHQYLPYDAPKFVARFLDHWQPSLALFVESDLWPNLILACSARRVPMVLINGRMSPRSFPRWQRAAQTIAALLGRFDICLAQSQLDAERLKALGADSVAVTGNLKWDVAAPPVDNARLERLMALTRGRRVVAAASTHPGEEEILIAAHKKLAVYFPGLLTVIAPRHPQRGAAVARLASEAGVEVALRSREQLPGARTGIYVADTMGELGLFYRLAPIVFMGGSLVPHGGQNPIEPAKLGAAIVHGPHTFNFTEVYEAFDRAGGARLAANESELVREFGRLINDAAARQAAIARAEQVVAELGGALERTLDALRPYLLQLRFDRGAADA